MSSDPPDYAPIAAEGGGLLGSGVEAPDVVLSDAQVIFRVCEVHGPECPPGPNSGEVSADLAWGEQAVRSGMFPWHMDVADQWTSQPQLPAGGSDQPAPAIGGCRVSRANGSPTERLLEEAERVLDGEAAQIPAPQAEAGTMPLWGQPGNGRYSQVRSALARG